MHMCHLFRKRFVSTWVKKLLVGFCLFCYFILEFEIGSHIVDLELAAILLPQPLYCFYFLMLW